MRSVNARFSRVTNVNPCWGDYICLNEAVRGQRFTRRTLYSMFIKLVPADDYQKSDITALVDHLYSSSNHVEECTMEEKIQLRDVLDALDVSDIATTDLISS